MPIQLVGRGVKRLEDPKLITGADPYVNDVRLEGALQLAFVRSPHAHAVLKRIDTTAARKTPGVVAVLTGADINAEVGVIHTPIPPEMFASMNRQGYTMLAEGRVRHVGEPVAVVAAETAQAAVDGAEAVVVDYEPLPAVVDSEAALRKGAPLLYPETGSNLAVSFKGEKGDVDAAFKKAPVVIDVKLINQRVIPLAMEPRACSAIWDAKAQKLTMWGDTQIPHGMRNQVAERLKLKPEQIHLMTGRVGGGFGAKVPVYQEDTIVPMLAKRLNRPVRWAATRREDMQSTGHGRDMRCHLRLAADSTGRILALDAKITGNVGYCLYHVGCLLPVLCAQMITGCYDIQTARAEVVCAFTNTMGTVPYRGAGRPEAAYFIERGMDLLAAKVGLDPSEVRRRNFIPPDKFPYDTALGNSYDSGEYTRALDHALVKAGYEELRRQQQAARAHGRLVGIGLASYVEICGFEEDEVSDLVVAADGHVTLLTGSASHGQGHETAYAQLVADELQIPMEMVKVVQGDTALVRNGVGTFGSRSAARGGMHALGQAVKVKEKAQQVAATLLEAAAQDLVLADGKFTVRGVRSRRHLAAGRRGRQGQSRLARGHQDRRRHALPLRLPRRRGRGGQGHGPGQHPPLHVGGRRGIPHQPAPGPGPGARRPGARHRAGALGRGGLRRVGPAPLVDPHGLRDPEDGRPDLVRERPHPHPLAADHARRQGDRRGRDHRLDARHRQRGHGRPRPAGRHPRGPAAHAAEDLGRHESGPKALGQRRPPPMEVTPMEVTL
ncbi:MAG: Carbon monoxide dehydrogenase [Candidatus Rokubacteria bacterium]|nr:Carbon monoxide dehydrogenase [Candidatus Rokubacteria bacterium]